MPMNTFAHHINSASRAPARFRDLLHEHFWLGSVLTAVIFFAITMATAEHIGHPVRDPERSFGHRLVFPVSLLLAFLFVDVLVRVVLQHRNQERSNWRTSVRRVMAERWQLRHFMIVMTGFVSFHITYLGYRNLKSFLPFIRPDTMFDEPLMEFDRWLLFGNAPIGVLHDLLGTNVAAHVLSTVYLVYLVFVPVSVAAALMWTSNIIHGYWYVTALIFNWIFGVVSYYILPSLGPAFAFPETVAELPNTGVTALQGWLVDNRLAVLADPIGSGSIQSIAGFASLHVSVVFTAFLVARRLRMRRVAIAMGVFLALTGLSTIYFGWHYITDDIAGLAIGWIAVSWASLLTGCRHVRSRGREGRRSPAPAS